MINALKVKQNRRKVTVSLNFSTKRCANKTTVYQYLDGEIERGPRPRHDINRIDITFTSERRSFVRFY